MVERYNIIFSLNLHKLNNTLFFSSKCERQTNHGINIIYLKWVEKTIFNLTVTLCQWTIKFQDTSVDGH